MINNFELYKDILRPVGENYVYHLIIINRSKETNFKSEHICLNYLLKDYNDLINLKQEIISLCEIYKSRAYIRVEPISMKDINLHITHDIAGYNMRGYKYNPFTIMRNGITEPLDFSQYLFVDVDEKDIKNDVVETLIKMFAADPHIGKSEQYIRENLNEYIIADIPSKAGNHLVTVKFDTHVFNRLWKGVHVLSGWFPAGCLLYYPDSLDKKTE